MAASGIIARNLKRFRSEQEISINELSRRSGLAKQTIIGIETGRGNPTIETLEELASALGVGIRALLSELGSDMLMHSGDAIQWHEQAGMRVRQLDQAFGSGYVYNSVLRLDANQGPSHHRAASRGSLRHCYVLEGRVRLGPESTPASAKTSDFVRFPADTPHMFEAITPIAFVFVNTTAPQLTMAGGDRFF
ncbi:anaerobic benzoate catabolism transcriptional regulator [Microbacterium azadirachtae]|uniref:Anaerobic benzoate catabolism transcriptional regulator n=1 Tax=Microbacterium azadirachtae TaxID=582680 RepID=A0A0F0L0G5_9MICO|nr:XRE family transcriptional regulator [Microbacterium azadirachtae]KJL26598.1 anaerobic benzoate catabolism transcriptional regulator [Microbacterium azadirachtae]